MSAHASSSSQESPKLQTTSLHTESVDHADSPSFICTICWQSQPPNAKPKLLGTSARIVCRQCWRAVLDLSICWVCGVCIVRGDESVSLGWCFWHLSCFGCLVCGTRMKAPGDPNDHSFGDNIVAPEKEKTVVRGQWGNWEDSTDGRLRSVGVELEEAPLCNSCSVKTAGESRSQVIERSLDTVSKFDSGLSKDHLTTLSEDGCDLRVSSRYRLQSTRRGRANTCVELSSKQLADLLGPQDTEDRVPLLDNAAAMGTSDKTDIYTSRDGTQSTSLKARVSVFNPVGEPAFRPSMTKPLPKWMDFLSNNANKERREREITMQVGRNSHRKLPSHGGGDVGLSGDGSSKTPDGTSLYPTPKVSPRILSPATHWSGDSTRAARGKKRATISFHPTVTKEIFEGLKDLAHERSKTIESKLSTPPGSLSTALPPRKRTPYPGDTRPEENIREEPSYFPPSKKTSYAAEPADEWCCEDRNRRSQAPSPEISSDEVSFHTISSIDSPHLLSPQPIKRNVPLLAKSSEYLEKYKPQYPKPQNEVYVAPTPEPIIEKLWRQKTRKSSTAEDAQERVRRRDASTLSSRRESEQSGRKELAKELSVLFGNL